MTNEEEQRLVTVCSECKMASCWRGIFVCDKAQGAGTMQLPVWRLRQLDREHSDYYAASDDYPEPEPMPVEPGRCRWCGRPDCLDKI